jgi:hypothetical protein
MDCYVIYTIFHTIKLTMIKLLSSEVKYYINIIFELFQIMILKV